MRSTGFIFISLLIHALLILGIALSPQQITEFTKGSVVEVDMTPPPTPTPGVPEAPKVTETAPLPTPTPAVAMPLAAPAPQPEAKVQPQPVAAQPVAKPTPAAAPKPVAVAPVKRAAKPIAKADDELPAKLNQPPPEKLDPAIEEAGVIPVGSERDQDTEASSADAKQAAVDPAPVGVKEEAAPEPASAAAPAPTEAAAPVAQPVPVAASAPAGELGKGGSTQAGAVEFTELKQMSGNRAPLYPLSARLEKRQGEVELLYRVTKDGQVTDISVAESSGSEDLDQEAVRAIAKFRFMPGQEGWAKHPVNFALKGDTAALPSRLRTKVGAQE